MEGQTLFRMIVEDTCSSVTGFMLKIKRVQALPNHELMGIRDNRLFLGDLGRVTSLALHPKIIQY